MQGIWNIVQKRVSLSLCCWARMAGLCVCLNLQLASVETWKIDTKFRAQAALLANPILPERGPLLVGTHVLCVSGNRLNMG